MKCTYYYRGRDMSFELIEDYTLDELKESLESGIVGWLAGEIMEAAKENLLKCNSHTEIAHWYNDYEPLYWQRHNHDIEDFRYEELGDRMASDRLVDFEDMGARDFWKFRNVIDGFRYAQFYRECDMLLAKQKLNLDDDDIDIMRI